MLHSSKRNQREDPRVTNSTDTYTLTLTAPDGRSQSVPVESFNRDNEQHIGLLVTTMYRVLNTKILTPNE